MSPIVLHLTGLTLFMVSPAFAPLAVHAAAWVTDRVAPNTSRHPTAEQRLAA